MGLFKEAWKRKSVERRELPRFPVRNEKIKFLLRDKEKVFALRDLSQVGIGIELSEHSEVLLFPAGQEYKARLNLSGDTYPIDLVVKRIDAASIGFRMQNITESLREKIQETLDPLRIAQSLKSIRTQDAPESLREGITRWYHGDMNSDLYLWQDSQKQLLRFLFFWNSLFWEWSSATGVRTGTVIPNFDKKLDLHYDPTPKHQTTYQMRKILENTQVLDYGLVEFLLKQE